MLLYCILYCIVLYCIVLYCIVLYCIVLYCIVLYCQIPTANMSHYITAYLRSSNVYAVYLFSTKIGMISFINGYSHSIHTIHMICWCKLVVHCSTTGFHQQTILTRQYTIYSMLHQNTESLICSYKRQHRCSCAHVWVMSSTILEQPL